MPVDARLLMTWSALFNGPDNDPTYRGPNLPNSPCVQKYNEHDARREMVSFMQQEYPQFTEENLPEHAETYAKGRIFKHLDKPNLDALQKNELVPRLRTQLLRCRTPS